MSQFPASSIAGGSTGTALYMFGQPSYPLIFRAAEERPPFGVSYRWWEDEATTILWAFNVDEIKRLIRFGLFKDEQLPRMALQTRNLGTIDDFLTGLARPRERLHLGNLSHVQKVEEIIQRCRMTAPPLVTWSWLPSRSADPLAIAKSIDTESHLHFVRISFEGLVRYSLGYSSSRVDWFFQQHTAFYALLVDHLNAFPEDLARYAEVENHLRSRSPFAHRAVARALASVGLQLNLPVLPRGFDFIAAPIQRLFTEFTPVLASVLKVLAVLGIRFERTYLHSPEMNWTRPFSVGFSFLEDIITSTSTDDLARALTSADEREFGKLIEDQIFDHGVANRLAIAWEVLSTDVWECCRAVPDLLEYIQGSLEPLLALRNYHSLTAILNGLHRYSISLSTFVRTETRATVLSLGQILPPEYFYLLEPHQNHAAYRQQYQQAPGIPFLIPHLNEFHQHGDAAIQYLLGHLTAVIPT
ncbi:hypothetical protein BJY04DRAFT_169827 [Aspergillus karnatakaensis]|uniref:uncharacterized protein n=1 Tax=Aspergillus karnatakaensis TaxID=1810916 RepID=UPI003CCDC6F1